MLWYTFQNNFHLNVFWVFCLTIKHVGLNNISVMSAHGALLVPMLILFHDITWRHYSTPYIIIYKTHQIPKLKCFSPCLAVVYDQSNEARCEVENEDVVGAAPTPTTSEWSTILFPTKVRLILETWRYIDLMKYAFQTKFHWNVFWMLGLTIKHW